MADQLMHPSRPLTGSFLDSRNVRPVRHRRSCQAHQRRIAPKCHCIW